MPAWLELVLGVVVAFLGGAGTLALAQLLRGRGRPQEPAQPLPPTSPPAEAVEASRDALGAAHEARTEVVREALDGEDPEGDVADLLNRRHP